MSLASAAVGIARLIDQGRVKMDRRTVGRVLISVDLETEDSALKFLVVGSEYFKEHDVMLSPFRFMKGHVIQNVVHGGKRPWKVDLTFVSAGWVETKKDERNARRGR